MHVKPGGSIGEHYMHPVYMRCYSQKSPWTRKTSCETDSKIVAPNPTTTGTRELATDFSDPPPYPSLLETGVFRGFDIALLPPALPAPSQHWRALHPRH